jgi:2-dehydro-3-deoxyglucarate aldolase
MAGSSNPVRQALLERRLCIGTWIQVGHPAVAEVLAEAGFAWIAVDCEHTDIGLESLGAVLRGMQGRPVVPFVRARENDTLAIRQALDLGARGVIVPLINTAEEAEAAVRAAKYPPRGERGYGFCRANDHGSRFGEYVKTANEDVAVVVMIESRLGVENIESILEVDGVDGIFLGPYDLSGSYGVPGDIEGPAVEAAGQRVKDMCRKHGKSSGLHVVKPTENNIRHAIDSGFTFLALGIDTVFMDQAARLALQTAKMGR